MDKILAAAKTIATARRSRSPLSALSSELVPADEAAGYRIQRAVHDLLLPQTGSLVLVGEVVHVQLGMSARGTLV